MSTNNSNNNSGIQMVGLEEIQEKLEKIANPQNIYQALGQCCAIVERSAKQKAPKDTGALRRSITSKVDGLQGIVYTPLEYAPYVEYGTGLFAMNGGRTDVPWMYRDDEGKLWVTSGQKPQPFMQPALDENRTEILERLKESITNND